MKRPAIFLVLFVFALSPALCRADSDGYFCIGDGYLAYDFWHDDGYRYLHVVWIGGTHGIRGPMTIRMEPGQPHGYRCASAKIEVFMWNRIDEYDVSEPGVIRFVRSRPAPEGRAPEGFVSQSLGARAEPGVVALAPSAGQHRYELRISKGTFFTTTELLELTSEGIPIKRLKIFEGNTSVHTHDFDIEEYPQQARSSPHPVGLDCDEERFDDISQLLHGYTTRDIPSLIERARKIEAFITCRPNDPRRLAALYALGHYKHQIARASPGLKPEAFPVFKRYIDDHEDDYRLDEINTRLLYEGRDWRRIFQETPSHDLADDAAYYYYTRPRGGECEGYPSCSCSRSLQANEPFMRQFPESEYLIKCLHDIQEQCWLNIPDLNQIDAWARRHLEEDRPSFLEALKECLKLYTNLKEFIPRASWLKLRRMFRLLGEREMASHIDAILNH